MRDLLFWLETSIWWSPGPTEGTVRAVEKYALENGTGVVAQRLDRFTRIIGAITIAVEEHADGIVPRETVSVDGHDRPRRSAGGAYAHSASYIEEGVAFNRLACRNVSTHYVLGSGLSHGGHGQSRCEHAAHLSTQLAPARPVE